MNADHRETLFGVAVAVFTVLAIVWLAVFSYGIGFDSGYRNGWCESQNGVYIADGKCDVAGHVKSITNAD